jgi:uncharacterized protein YacL
LPITISVVLATVISFALSSILNRSWLNIIISVAISSLIFILLAYCITFNKQERESVKALIQKSIRKFKS